MTRRILFPAIASVLLAGCSGEPNSDDILQALNADPKFQMTLGMLAGSQANLDAVKKNGVVEKSGCKDAQGAPGYVCDFRWGTKGPDGKIHYGNPMRARLFKASQGWAGEF
jgi:hypothetical protein